MTDEQKTPPLHETPTSEPAAEQPAPAKQVQEPAQPTEGTSTPPELTPEPTSEPAESATPAAEEQQAETPTDDQSEVAAVDQGAIAQADPPQGVEHPGPRPTVVNESGKEVDVHYSVPSGNGDGGFVSKVEHFLVGEAKAVEHAVVKGTHYLELEAQGLFRKIV